MSRGWRRTVGDPVATWRTGTPASQVMTLAVLLVCVSGCWVISLINYQWMPLTTYFVWLLLGMLLLRFRSLRLLVLAILVLAITAAVAEPEMTTARMVAILSLTLGSAIVLFASSRQQSGLPGPVSEAMLTDLSARLQSQGTIPPLPQGWEAQSAMVAASGVSYGGDFLIANLVGSRLELILVDVCGKGVGAASRALHFGGALGGLIGALPAGRLMCAANTFLLRQQAPETFATAVHVEIDLDSGAYVITNAGHPPALVWSTATRTWTIDGARGMALGIVPDLESTATCGVLRPGDALMFYTDGVIEALSKDLDEGVARLSARAKRAVATDFQRAADQILAGIRSRDDDCAVLILERSRTPAQTAAPTE